MAVAASGRVLSKQQLRLIESHGSRVISLLDPAALDSQTGVHKSGIYGSDLTFSLDRASGA